MKRADMKSYASAMQGALASRRDALQVELAVSFAVLLECEMNRRVTRETLCQIYTDVGYKATEPSDRDWKSINRRITAAMALFDFIGEEEVRGWLHGETKRALIERLIDHIKPFKVATVNEILTITEKVKPPATRTGPRPPPEGSHVFHTEHIHIVVPPTATRTEIMETALGMMKLAEDMLTAEVAAAQEKVTV